MITNEQIIAQEKLVDAYREEFKKYNKQMEASRQRATRAIAKLQNMKLKQCLTPNGGTEMEFIA